MTFELLVTLDEVENPKVWRKILVSENITFHDLHTIIQISFGWDNYHLYKFLIGEKEKKRLRISKLTTDFILPDYNSESTKLKDVFKDSISEIEYIYDFRDNWIHKICINKISSKFDKTAICTEGEGTCPPEDCGGPWAFMEMKEVLKKPESEECKLMLKWLNLKKCEDWNLKYFDKELVNKFLEELNFEENKSETELIII